LRAKAPGTPVLDSEGQKLWEGTKNDITHSGIKELDDFVFANIVMNSLRDGNGKMK